MPDAGSDIKSSKPIIKPNLSRDNLSFIKAPNLGSPASG